MANSSRRLVLSLFPGVGLLDRAFDEAGWCVVRGPDLLWGGDIRRFKPPRGIWDGVIGGPPCQDFSAARRAHDPQTGNGLAMLEEFSRCVAEAEPDWWLCENVVGVPDVVVDGYDVQRLHVEQAWFVPIRRLRAFQFGRHATLLDATRPLHIPRGKVITPNESCAMASDSRPFEVLKRLQGLPSDFELPGFSDEGRRRAVGNGVGLVLGRVVARAVGEALGHDDFAAVSQTNVGPDTLRAELGHEGLAGSGTLPTCAECGIVVTGRQKTCSDACRTTLSRRRRGLLKRRGDA